MSQNLFDLKDQVALITGGSGVLGMVFARALAEQGAKIIIADIDEQRCKECAAEITKLAGEQALGLLLDVADQQGGHQRGGARRSHVRKSRHPD